MSPVSRDPRLDGVATASGWAVVFDPAKPFGGAWVARRANAYVSVSREARASLAPLLELTLEEERWVVALAPVGRPLG